MIKKIFVLLLALCLVAPSICLAESEKANLFKNSGFEFISKTGINCLGWTASNAEVCDTEKYEGERSVHMVGVGSIGQTFSGIVERKEYDFSVQVKAFDGAVPAVKVIWGNEEGSIFEEMVLFEGEFTEEEWSYVGTTFKAPPKATSVTVNIRSRWGVGEIYFDEASFYGRTTVPVEDYTASETVEVDTKHAAGKTEELVTNGDFELAEAGKASAWTVAYPDRCVIVKNEAHSGENALKISTKGAAEQLYRVGIAQDMHFVSGYPYTLSFYAYGISEGMNISVSMGIGGESVVRSFSNIPKGKWTEYGFSFVAPATVVATLIIRLFNTEGEIYLDDISMIGEQYKKVVELKEPFEGTSELFVNGDFETPNKAGNGPGGGWLAYGTGNTENWSNSKKVFYTDEKAHSGTHSVKVENLGTNANPWVRFMVEDIIPGAEYQISAWVYCDDLIQSGIGHKVEWYSKPGLQDFVASTSSKTLAGNTNGKWEQIVDTYRAPDNARYAAVYLRVYSVMEMYFDDASFYQIDGTDAIPVRLLTNDVFYYSDSQDDGFADVLSLPLNMDAFHMEFNENWTADFKLSDGETVLLSEEGVRYKDGKIRFEYPMSLLSELKKEYMVSAMVHAENGETYEVWQPIYKYDRPTAIGADGRYRLDNGELFVPYIAYWPGDLRKGPHYIEYCKEIGMNVIQTASTRKLAEVGQMLDLIHSHGLMALVCLYPDMQSAGHDRNIENTIQTVTKYMDHPAVFAWALLDEPGIDESREEELIRAYRTIRDIDSHHPVYICDYGHLETITRLCDVFTVDDYYDMSGYGANVVELNTVTRYRQPHFSLMEAYVDDSSIEEIRYTFYDAFFEGAYGGGYYAISDVQQKESLAQLREDLKVFNQSGELPEARNHFALSAYPILCEEKNDQVAYSAYVKDGALHLVVMNRSREDATFEIPLHNADKSVAVGPFTAKVIYGGEGTLEGDGTLSAELDKFEVLVYEITPETAVDFTSLPKRTEFLDLDITPWAKDAILMLEAKGIVNCGESARAYSPARNITRADFAMFLIRSLGLQGNYTSSFSDVDKNAYYAKEIAIGEALGILQGVGENQFQPESFITRQDMMTILSRGLCYKNKLQNADESVLSQFTDSEQVADYAKAAASDVVGAGIIRGNADNTLNPLGNTTRAEAAVIMQRILQ